MPSDRTAQGRVLIIAGSDPSGGAGIQADIKTVTVLGGYAMSAITALTVQNTLGVTAIHPVSAEVVKAQALAALDDIGADAIKTGMLGDRATVEVCAEVIDRASGVPAVIDPVMAAKGGTTLLDSKALDAFARLLIPRAALLTPNAPEAETLTGDPVVDLDGQRRAGDVLLRAGAKAVLVKGGHIPGDRVTDVLLTPLGETLLEGPRIETGHTHGTGCTLASACAAGLAQGMSLEDSVARAWAYVAESIRQAPGLGSGHGPLGHGWPIRKR